MKIGLTRSVRRSAVGALVAALVGCGGDEVRPPVEVITPQPVRGILAQTSFVNFQSDIWLSIELIVTQKGVLDITVDWTFADTWLYVYLGSTSCSFAQLTERNCPFVLASESKDPKPRVLFTGTLEPGKYYLVLYNVPRDRLTGIGSDNTESVAIQLGLTVSPGDLRVPGGVSIGSTQLIRPGQ